MNSTLRRLARGEHGSNMVEMALCFSVLMMAVFGIIWGSLAVYADHYVAGAARAAARYASVRGGSWGTACSSSSSSDCTASVANIQSFVAAMPPSGLTASNVSATASWPGYATSGNACPNTAGSQTAGCPVNVTVTYNFNIVLPFLPAGAFNIRSTAASTIME